MTPNRSEMCQIALGQVSALLDEYPDDPALTSVQNQLLYLIGIESGVGDRSRMKDLILGRLAVYHLSDTISDDLSKMLCTISDGVRRELRTERLEGKGG